MPSVLTRTIFRRLLTNDAYIFSCANSVSYATRRSRHTTGISSHNTPIRTQRRSFFGLATKAARVPKDTSLVPGLQEMLNLSLMEDVGARLPRRSELITAWRKYMAYKVGKDEAVNGVQARHVVRCYCYLRDSAPTDSAGGNSKLTIDDLQRARFVMGKIPTNDRDYSFDMHIYFAREMYKLLSAAEGIAEDAQVSAMRNLQHLISVLSVTEPSSARSLVEELPLKQRRSPLLWHAVIRGVATQGDEEALLSTMQSAERAGIKHDSVLKEIMTNFYMRRNDVEKVKTWYAMEMATEKDKVCPKTLSHVLSFSIRNDQLSWCNDVFRAVLQDNPDKPTWDIVFQWAAAGQGKGVEDIEHMMKVMQEHNKGDTSVQPDIATINGLVSFAMAKKDPYLAERYLAMGLRSGIYPDARTNMLQMDYRIDAGDISGVHSAYMALQGKEIGNNEDLAVINKYLRALCTIQKPDYDRITAVAADLDDRQARLEASTVSAMCKMHFDRDEMQNALDVLNSHAFHHTHAERQLVMEELVKFCFDRNNSVARTWDVYTITRRIFDELTVETRTNIMMEFFERRRSDMAIHVFGHMRQHIQPDMRPTTTTYVRCFEGIASCTDMQSLDIVHNMLKMDASIEPSTLLYNALMVAFTACEEPYRAMDFWKDITNSREGPNYRSLEIVFWICELKSSGDKEAKEIWDRMRRMEIEITPEVFAGYLGALAGQGMWQECKKLAEGCMDEHGFQITAYMIGVLYNAIPGQRQKDEVEEWAAEMFPDQCATLRAAGKVQQLEGFYHFNIIRNLAA